MSGPADGRGKELVSLGKRTHPGPRTSTTVLIDSHVSFPKARLARAILACPPGYRMPGTGVRLCLGRCGLFVYMGVPSPLLWP